MDNRSGLGPARKLLGNNVHPQRRTFRIMRSVHRLASLIICATGLSLLMIAPVVRPANAEKRLLSSTERDALWHVEHADKILKQNAVEIWTATAKSADAMSDWMKVILQFAEPNLVDAAEFGQSLSEAADAVSKGELPESLAPTLDAALKTREFADKASEAVSKGDRFGAPPPTGERILKALALKKYKHAEAAGDFIETSVKLIDAYKKGDNDKAAEIIADYLEKQVPKLGAKVLRAQLGDRAFTSMADALAIKGAAKEIAGKIADKLGSVVYGSTKDSTTLVIEQLRFQAAARESEDAKKELGEGLRNYYAAAGLGAPPLVTPAEREDLIQLFHADTAKRAYAAKRAAIAEMDDPSINNIPQSQIDTPVPLGDLRSKLDEGHVGSAAPGFSDRGSLKGSESHDKNELFYRTTPYTEGEIARADHAARAQEERAARAEERANGVGGGDGWANFFKFAEAVLEAYGSAHSNFPSRPYSVQSSVPMISSARTAPTFSSKPLIAAPVAPKPVVVPPPSVIAAKPATLPPVAVSAAKPVTLPPVTVSAAKPSVVSPPIVKPLVSVPAAAPTPQVVQSATSKATSSIIQPAAPIQPAKINPDIPLEAPPVLNSTKPFVEPSVPMKAPSTVPSVTATIKPVAGLPVIEKPPVEPSTELIKKPQTGPLTTSKPAAGLDANPKKTAPDPLPSFKTSIEPASVASEKPAVAPLTYPTAVKMPSAADSKLPSRNGNQSDPSIKPGQKSKTSGPADGAKVPEEKASVATSVVPAKSAASPISSAAKPLTEPQTEAKVASLPAATKPSVDTLPDVKAALPGSLAKSKLPSEVSLTGKSLPEQQAATAIKPTDGALIGSKNNPIPSTGKGNSTLATPTEKSLTSKQNPIETKLPTEPVTAGKGATSPAPESASTKGLLEQQAAVAAKSNGDALTSSKANSLSSTGRGDSSTSAEVSTDKSLVSVQKSIATKSVEPVPVGKGSTSPTPETKSASNPFTSSKSATTAAPKAQAPPAIGSKSSPLASLTTATKSPSSSSSNATSSASVGSSKSIPACCGLWAAPTPVLVTPLPAKQAVKAASPTSASSGKPPVIASSNSPTSGKSPTSTLPSKAKPVVVGGGGEDNVTEAPLPSLEKMTHGPVIPPDAFSPQKTQSVQNPTTQTGQTSQSQNNSSNPNGQNQSNQANQNNQLNLIQDTDLPQNQPPQVSPQPSPGFNLDYTPKPSCGVSCYTVTDLTTNTSFDSFFDSFWDN